MRCPIFNFTDRGAVLDGTTLVHPDDGVELIKAVSDNIEPFEAKEEQIELKKQVTGRGLELVLSLLVSYCDQIWDFVNRCEKGNPANEILQDICNDSELASFLGDFAFVVMPRLRPYFADEKTLLYAVRALKRITYVLEDAILECSPSEDFSMSKILTRGN